MIKNWYQSKTLWANVVAGAVTLAGVFGINVGLDAETQAQLVGGIMVIVNIVLRFVTKDPIA
jgi:hypothetical protein